MLHPLRLVRGQEQGEVSKSIPRQTDDLISGLPGEKLVRQGLEDFSAGRRTVAACLVRIARPRLSRVGLMPPGIPGQSSESELQLYALLSEQGGDAYSRYNALLRELVSFESALDTRRPAGI